MGFIYKITNILQSCDDYMFNYIGQTKQPIKRRFNQHCATALRECDTSNYFHNAIRKYGKDNFKIELLKEVDDSLLDIEEINEIFYRKSIGEAQYNIAEGGYNNPFKFKSKEELKSQLN